ncbi:MAG TPA: M48 family metalloprotease, partial [Rhodothermales bacterium]|nr:M48 family metalloprotease [Rhodothermales bacterium]
MRFGRLIAAFFALLLAVGGYFFSTRKEVNPVTGETQRVALTVDQEIALGLQSAPEMAQQFGGELPDAQAQAMVDRIGNGLVQANLPDTPYRFDFHLLADPQTVNAFALPGGQIFITAALAERLQTEGQLAGVLGHEIGHVVGRHSAEQMAKAMLYQGLANAGTIATYDPNNPNVAAAVPQLVAQLTQMKHGRDDGLQSDELGVRFLAEAGYDPRALISVMQILEEASGGARQPEFASTHPNPGNRIERIEATIRARFPR